MFISLCVICEHFIRIGLLKFVPILHDQKYVCLCVGVCFVSECAWRKIYCMVVKHKMDLCLTLLGHPSRVYRSRLLSVFSGFQIVRSGRVQKLKLSQS